MAKSAQEDLKLASFIIMKSSKSGLEKVALVMALEEQLEADAARERWYEIWWNQKHIKAHGWRRVSS